MSTLPFSASFPKHDCARRKFRVRVYAPTLDEMVVEILDSGRVRFRSGNCLKTFTEYPLFSLPHKRFVKQDVLAKVEKYLSAEQPRCRATYREAVWEGTAPVSYAKDQEGHPLYHVSL